jgi:hypothetical protein
MAHCVSHQSGLRASEFTAVLDAIQKYGRSWRTESLRDQAMVPLVARIGAHGVQEITVSGLALQLQSSADLTRGMFRSVG